MAYKDKAQQREYQQGWIRDRRASFFSGKACVQRGMVHGTVQAYWKGCRCASCRAANAAYKRALSMSETWNEH